MLKRFTRYVTQSVAGMIGISVYVLADTFFISVYSGADGLADRLDADLSGLSAQSPPEQSASRLCRLGGESRRPVAARR